MPQQFGEMAAASLFELCEMDGGEGATELV